MTQRIILFNGPPGCGKDTAAKWLFDHWAPVDGAAVVFDRMSIPSKKAFAGTVGCPVRRYGYVDGFEERKEDLVPTFGVSYRQWQIDFSERFMKPLYGESIFAKLFIERAGRQQNNAVILVPDCGFDIEYHTLVPEFGMENVLVVKIYRPGCDFRKDSRNYIKVGSFGTKIDTEHVIHLNNSGTKEEFEAKVLKSITKWLEKRS